MLQLQAHHFRCFSKTYFPCCEDNLTHPVSARLTVCLLSYLACVVKRSDVSFQLLQALAADENVDSHCSFVFASLLSPSLSHSDFHTCVCALIPEDRSLSLLHLISNIRCWMLTGAASWPGRAHPSHSCLSSVLTPEFLSTIYHLGNLPNQIGNKENNWPPLTRQWGNGCWSWGVNWCSLFGCTFQQNHPTPGNPAYRYIWAFQRYSVQNY